MGRAQRDMYLDMHWDDLRSELLSTGDPRKELLVDVMDGVMESYRAKLSIRNDYAPQGSSFQSEDGYSANGLLSSDSM
jgi:hypothetical protein